MARAVKADPADLAGYDWFGRTIKRHRTEIRQHFGSGSAGRRMGPSSPGSLASDAAQRERRYELIKEHFLGECLAVGTSYSRPTLPSAESAATAIPDIALIPPAPRSHQP
jgi:hypothetical protein